MCLQELNETVKAMAEAVATLPWALTDNFMEMRQGRAVLQLSGPGSSLAAGMGSSYLREAVKKVLVVLATSHLLSVVGSSTSCDLDASLPMLPSPGPQSQQELRWLW